MAKIIKPGCHGTSKENAKKINLEGFTLSPKGKLGSGVYIWEEQEGYRELAEDWHAQCLKQGRYSGEWQLAIIYCTCEVEPPNFLDMTDPEVIEMIKAWKITENNLPSGMMYDWVVERLESRLQTKILLVRSPVSKPAPIYPKYRGRDPITLLAKCQTILSITKIEGL